MQNATLSYSDMMALSVRPLAQHSAIMLKSDKTPCLLVVFWGETKGKAALCRFQIVKTCCGAVFVILAGGWGENF